MLLDFDLISTPGGVWKIPEKVHRRGRKNSFEKVKNSVRILLKEKSCEGDTQKEVSSCRLSKINIVFSP